MSASPLRRSLTPLVTKTSSLPLGHINSTTPSRPAKKQKMSIMQAYSLAQTARVKLAREASRADHDLRLLVGHANILDGLMLELAEAEQDQERWFNQTVKGASSEEPRHHIQWADTVIEDPEDDWAIEDADSDSSDDDDEYDEDEEMSVAAPVPVRRAPSPPFKVSVSATELSDDEEEDEEDEDYNELTLVRTSTSSHQPPELLDDSEGESEDESMPPSPPQPNLDLSEQDRKAIATTGFYQDLQKPSPADPALSPKDQTSFFDEGYYLPQRQATTMIDAY
ncbi:MAG: hypothetical protein M1817_002864 [Caeruleum heppii]|nr:MAG: hypothetical protein M1817_002864 [Caeruleum heppii]